MIKKICILIFTLAIIFSKSSFVQAETRNDSLTSLTDTDNITIKTSAKMNDVMVDEQNIHLVNGGVLNCAFTVQNDSDSEKNISVIFATYTENNQLNYIESLNFAVQACSSETKNIEYEFDITKESKGKIMFWNGISRLIPIKGCLYFDKEGATSYFYDLNNRLIQADKADGTSIILSYDSMGNLLRKTVRK